MAWTYSAFDSSDPNQIQLDTFRITVGDVDTNNQLLEDGECRYYYNTVEPADIRLAAARALDDLSSFFAVKADLAVGEVKKSLSQVSVAYQRRAERVRLEAGKLAVPFFGGQSIATKQNLADNTDAPQPRFTSNQFDNPLASQMDSNPVDPFLPNQ